VNGLSRRIIAYIGTIVLKLMAQSKPIEAPGNDTDHMPHCCDQHGLASKCPQHINCMLNPP
jgi:hypothetical protein